MVPIVLATFFSVIEGIKVLEHLDRMDAEK